MAIIINVILKWKSWNNFYSRAVRYLDLANFEVAQEHGEPGTFLIEIWKKILLEVQNWRPTIFAPLFLRVYLNSSICQLNCLPIFTFFFQFSSCQTCNIHHSLLILFAIFPVLLNLFIILIDFFILSISIFFQFSTTYSISSSG